MRSTASVLLAFGLAATAIAGATSATVHVQPPTEIGNAACRSCHREIYDAYARTPMARTSGPALAGLVEGEFAHARSGIRYRVFAEGDRAALSFERPGDAAVRGRVPLKYFVGSNTRGRTFLFEIDRFLYQSPINYYARSRTWDMSPGYADLTAMPLNHAVDQTCLSCHASQLAAVEPGTTNRFEGEAFRQDGVGCERCHGPGSDHAAGHGGMIDPAHLTAEARDSVCTQCHLEGQARIARAGKTLTDFQPGQRLSDPSSSLSLPMPPAPREAPSATSSRSPTARVSGRAATGCRACRATIRTLAPSRLRASSTTAGSA